MTKAAFLGTTALSDAFSVAFLIPNLLRRLFAENSISVAFIPTFRDYLEREDSRETRQFLSATVTLITLITTVTVTAGIICAPLIVPFFGTTTGETVLLTRLMFPYLAIISLAALFQGILNGVRVFSPSGFTPILFNICVIGTTWLLSPRMANPARAMAVGVLLGGAVQAFFQVPFVFAQGFPLRLTSPRKAFSNPGTRAVLRLIGPTILGMAAYQLNDVVSSALAGNAGEGVLSSLQYSLRLQELMLGIFAVSIGTVILPDLSSFASRADWPAFNRLLARAMNIIALIMIPVTFFALATGDSLIVLLYKTRNFSDESVRLTYNAFIWHMAGLFFIALNRIVSPAFYAQKDTKSPTTAGLFSFAINIGIALLLFKPLQGGGIALALSLASLANTIALFFFMKRKKTFDVPLVLKSVSRYVLKIVLFSLIAAAPVYFLKPKLWQPFAQHGRLIAQGVPLTLSLLLFAAIGVGLLVLTRDPLLSGLAATVKGKIKAQQ